MRPTIKIGSFALAGALALTLSACGSNSSGTGSASGGASGGASSGAASSAPSAAPTPAAQVDSLSGKMTQVTLDAGFVKALTSLKLTPAPVGKASVSKAGVATFPITGGNVTYYAPGSVDPYVQGIIHHEGSGLSLTGGGIKVALTNFDVDPGKSVLTGDVSANGKSAAKGAALFILDGSTLKPLQANSDGTAVLAGTTVKLTQAAADLLNKTYKVKALKEGLVIGIAKITINTK